MKFIADFHIHSHYSLATSKELKPEHLDYWAALKGVQVVGSGDFSHPSWTRELREKVQPTGNGLFTLKDEFKIDKKQKQNTSFLLTAEISNIYKKSGKTRKVHNVIVAPDFETVEKIQNELLRLKFNITSDGRPILGMDSKDLLDLVLNINENIMFIPAHIWTPWFSVLGDKSGYDSVQECYEELTKHIYAVETGLSSDSPMNWMCSHLDNFTLLSNSDAHSPDRLGRNANIFDTELSYQAIYDAIKFPEKKEFVGTIDLFPQEGKYHYDGHRKCGICWTPLETLKHNEICPVCNKKITVGVMNRVAQLSDRSNIYERKNQSSFFHLIPLKELLSEILGVGDTSKSLTANYFSILQKYGSELDILMNIPVEEFRKNQHHALAEALQRMRNEEIFIDEGYDGEYGSIKVFKSGEKKKPAKDALFHLGDTELPRATKRPLINFDMDEFLRLKNLSDIEIESKKNKIKKVFENPVDELNEQQLNAVNHFEGAAFIIAGPGTGKTKVLTLRIFNLIKNKNILPSTILAVTFTNKAANEMLQRLKELAKNEFDVTKLHCKTFHAFGLELIRKYCYHVLRKPEFIIIKDDDKEIIFSQYIDCDKKQIKKIIDEISKAKQQSDFVFENQESQKLFEQYNKYLSENNLVDFDDLIYLTVNLLKQYPEILKEEQQNYQWILVDEFQDINAGQYELIKLLTGENQNLFVIGDPNQAIYGFRGADVKFVNQFLTDFPDATTYQLTKSYRCSERILRASEDIIENETLLEGLQTGVKINISRHATDKAEAENIARTIEKITGGMRFFSIDSNVTAGTENSDSLGLSDIVVLTRTRQQLKVVEKAMNDHGIPFQSTSEESIFAVEPLCYIIDFLKLINQPANQFTFDKLKKRKLIKSIKEIEKINPQNKTVENYVNYLVDTYFSETLNINDLEFRQFLAWTKLFDENLSGFLDFATLGNGMDLYKPNIENVSLMTLHASKGLEFKAVFIAGCEDGLIPYTLYRKDTDVAEEKRLLYVGMTRAEEQLFLSSAENRFVINRIMNLSRSPFIDSIEKELVELQKRQSKAKEVKASPQMSLF